MSLMLAVRVVVFIMPTWLSILGLTASGFGFGWLAHGVVHQWRIKRMALELFYVSQVDE